MSNTTPKDQAHASQRDKAEILFSEFPHEINMIILNLLEADTLLLASRTCKRWMNNTKYLEHLSLCLTKGRVREFVGNPSMQKVPKTRLAVKNWEPLQATFERFDPKRLKSLYLYPNLEQNNEIVNNFVSKATNITQLQLCSLNYRDTLLKFPKDHLKELILEFEFDDSFIRFTNLERLQFTVRHSHFCRTNLDIIMQFKHLKALTLNGAAAPYLQWEQLAQMTHLKELNLDYAYLADNQFAILSTLTNLEILRMSHLQKEIPEDEIKKQMEMLVRRQVGNPNPVSGLRHLTNLVNLTYLDISHVGWTRGENGGDFSGVADLVENHFKKLKVINITGTKLGKANRDKLKAIKGLTVIDQVAGYDVNDDDEEELFLE